MLKFAEKLVPKRAKQWPFGLQLEASGHSFTYFWVHFVFTTILKYIEYGVHIVYEEYSGSFKDHILSTSGWL